MGNKKIAIACQGGGSQTAFTAGVLKCFIENEVHKKWQIVSLSGTSGGAICATLLWHSLVKAARENSVSIEQPLLRFWKDNSTRNLYDELVNDLAVRFLQLADCGYLPRWQVSPSSPLAQIAFSLNTAFAPNKTFYDFKELLNTHINFEEIAAWGKVESPALLLGAADVINGQFIKFSSIRGEIQVDTLLASAAVPTIFPAVKIGRNFFWDGIFSDNPPTDELLDENHVGKNNMPDELWIIQINPTTCKEVPTSAQDIVDRQNEMIGNQSLNQDLDKVRLINRYLEEEAFTQEYIQKKNYRHIDIHIIPISDELQEVLSYATKLDRNHRFIEQLMLDGENQGRKFLATLNP